MVKRVQIVRHTTTVLADAFTGLVGELSVDMEKDELRVHDAVKAGGHVLLKEDLGNIRDLSVARATLEVNTNWDLKAVSDLSTNGFPVRTGAATAASRSIAGTANEITLTNGDGVSGNPTVSLPASLTFTGKTITDGTFNGIDIGTGGVISGSLGGSGTVDFSSLSSLTFAADQISGNAIHGGDISGDLTLSGSTISVTNDLVVSGMLTASLVAGPIAGTSDAIFVINSDVVGAPSENSGIRVNRGTSNPAEILFDETDDKWKQDPGTGTLTPLGGVEKDETLISAGQSEIEIDFGSSEFLTKHIRIIMHYIELANTATVNNVLNMQLFNSRTAAYYSFNKYLSIDRNTFSSTGKNLQSSYSIFPESGLNIPIIPEFTTGGVSGPYFNLIMDLYMHSAGVDSVNHFSANWKAEKIEKSVFKVDFYKGHVTVLDDATNDFFTKVKFLMDTAVNFEAGRYQIYELS